MTCKYCGTSLDGIRPDEQGVITCPGCGKRYVKRQAPAAAQTEAPRPAQRVNKPNKPSWLANFMSLKLGGKVPAWCVAAAALVLVIVLAVVLFSSGSGNGSPKALLNLYEDGIEGDAKALWNCMPPYMREEYFDNDYSKFKPLIEEAMGDMKIKADFDYVGYEKNKSYDKDDEYRREESGTLEFKYTVKYDDDEESGTQKFDIVKIDGKWYVANIGMFSGL